MDNDKKERKLTDKEAKRLEKFEAISASLTDQGYVRNDLIISILKANVVGPLLTLPFMAALVIVFFVIHGKAPVTAMLDSNGWGLILAGLSSIPLAVVHECIHGLSWSISAKNHLKDIEFGFIASNLTPYCYCASPLSKGMYLFGSMMPMTVLGIVLGIVGIIIASPEVVIAALIQCLGGSGDILISAMLLKYRTKGKDIVLMDHPTECGLVVFER